MGDRQIDWLPVLAHGKRVVGVLTSRDICVAAQSRRRRLDEVAVEGAMHTDVHACRPDDAIDNLLVAMENYRVKRLPVVDEGELVGVISLTDLANRAAHSGDASRAAELVRVLAAIHEPRSAVEKA
jgi:CBS domain-containing protein